MLTRRDMLKGSIGAGFALCSVSLWPNRARAAPGSHKTIVILHASGGKHDRLGLDPGLIAGENEANILQGFYGEEITGPLLSKVQMFSHRVDVGGMKSFYNAHWMNLVVFNGVVMPTNAHGAGTRAAARGSLIESYPSIGALTAAHYGSETPVSFLVSGGDGGTGSLLAAATLGQTQDLPYVLAPNSINPGNNDHRYIPSSVEETLTEARQSRLLRMIDDHTLPTHVEVLTNLLSVESGKPELMAVADTLTGDYPDGSNATIEAVLDLVASDMTFGVALSKGGFDTHNGGGQNQHGQKLADYYQFGGKLWERATDRGLADKMIILFTSEFSRTPALNGGGGTDHWNASASVAMLGKGFHPQVFGASDAGFYSLPVDPHTLLPKAGGVTLDNAGIHHVLRNIMKIPDKYKADFPLPSTDINVQEVVNRIYNT